MTGFTLLSSYPKSGSTWLRAIIESLRTGAVHVDINDNPAGILPAADRRTFDDLMGMNSSDLSAMEIAWDRSRVWHLFATQYATLPVIKIHDAFLPPWPGFQPPFPPDDINAVVYIVRDPRDVAVSFAYHFGTEIDAAVDCMADTRAFLDWPGPQRPDQLPQLLSSWSCHVESWLDAPGLRIQTIRYEDMHETPETAFSAVARFLDLDATREAIQRAIAASRFSALRAQEDNAGFKEREPHMDRFFRRGRAGDWREVLTASQAARIARDHGPVMSRLGYEA